MSRSIIESLDRIGDNLALITAKLDEILNSCCTTETSPEQVRCGSPNTITADGYAIANNSADKTAYISQQGITVDVEFPCTGLGGCPSPSWFDVLDIRMYASGSRINSANYTWTYNSYIYDQANSKIVANVTVSNPNAAGSSVWPHTIVVDGEVCSEV